MTAAYGILHPDGRYSVEITGHPFPSQWHAEQQAALCDLGEDANDPDGLCDFCGEPAGGRKHVVVTRPGPAHWTPA